MTHPLKSVISCYEHSNLAAPPTWDISTRQPHITMAVTSTSATPQTRNSAYCDYITGKEIKIPRQDNWNIEHNSDGITAECRFAEPVVINNVDIFFTERPEDAIWTGTAQLEGKTESGWKSLGWAVRANRNPDEQSYQSITLPAGEKVSALRIAAHGSGEIEIFDIVADQFGDLMYVS